ncbi:MAG: N-6 DNA methylase [Pseudomonadota bacterium]|nr:N-6 DNA methylase [Pseudomonadota bacterium]
MNIKQLEKDLWESADDLRANSKLTATEYAQPVLGLIFLSHATSRLYKLVEQLKQTDATAQRMAEMVKTVEGFPVQQYEDYIKGAFKTRNALYLEPNQRFDVIAQASGDQDLGGILDQVMRDIESAYPILSNVLPQTYNRFEVDLLRRLVRIFSRPALTNASGDVFGKIYEYFLNKFAMSGAQEGGEFFTPPSLVKTIVNFIEPDHGVVFDPACGSAGMFIQTTHFLEDRHIHNAKIRFVGQEKSENNQHLAVLNMVVHGLDATNILQGNTFYDRREECIGACDFVMANPPFNVDAVDATRCEVDVVTLPVPSKEQPNIPMPTALDYMQAATSEQKRLPFGLSGVTKRKSTSGERADGGADKNDVVSNANSLWIQYFYSYLNATGRAGFVMASSASDAGGRDREIRRQLVETGHVDVMVSIGPKFFYTRSLPCTLWFFDKGKSQDRLDHVLMLDARSVYTVVSAKSHVFSDAQLSALTAIVWLTRGETHKYNALLAGYLREIAEQLNTLPALVAESSHACRKLAALLSDFVDKVTLDELNHHKPKKDKDGNLLPTPTPINAEQLADYQARIRQDYAALGQLPPLVVATKAKTKAKAKKDQAAQAQSVQATDVQMDLIASVEVAVEPTEPVVQPVLVEPMAASYAPLLALSASVLDLLCVDSPAHAVVVQGFELVCAQRAEIEALRQAIIERHQQWLGMVEQGENIRAAQSKHWPKKELKAARLPLLPSSPDAREEEITVHDRVLACLDAVLQRLDDIAWLHSRFPDGVYADILGLCKWVSRAEIAANDYSLTAGRYVGVAEEADDLGDFAERMRGIHAELALLDDKAATLGQAIQVSFKELLG